MIWAEVPVDADGETIPGWRIADAGRADRWLRNERNLDEPNQVEEKSSSHLIPDPVPSLLDPLPSKLDVKHYFLKQVL